MSAPTVLREHPPVSPAGAARGPAAAEALTIPLPRIVTPTVAPEALDDDVRDLCANAVDPLEIAAGLEFGGLTDEGAGRYGHPDVFSYAEALYRRVPRRPAAEAGIAAPDPWRGNPMRHALRGALFGLPGLCYVTASQAVTGPTGVLVVSLLLAWAYGQGAAYLAYVAIGHGDRDAGLAIARWAMRLGIVLVGAVVVVTGWASGAGTPAVLLSLGQAAYLLAAGVLLVAEAELVLLAVLLPGCVLSGVYLLTGWPSPWLVWAGAALSVVLAIVLAEFAARPPRRVRMVTSGRHRADTSPSQWTWPSFGRNGTVPRARVRVPPLRGAVPPALFGGLCGALLTMGAPVPQGALLMVPLSLSMGAAEWAVFRFRRVGNRLLARSESARRFGWAARAALIRSLLSYCAVLVLLTAVAGIVLPPGAGGLLRMAANLALGGAVLVALILQSCGLHRVVLALFALAATAEAIVPSDPQAQSLLCLALVSATTAYALVVVGRTALHG